ncbi:MAG TPA: exosortase B [Caldimonas sp.]|nr:exosortase B [Caldimonas sp.]
MSRDPAAQALLIALAGFLAMMGPVYWWAANTIWQSDDHAHGAIVLAVVVWLFWTLRHRLVAVERQPAPVLGSVLFGFGLFVYFVGRMFDISILEMGSQIPVIAGGLLLLKGPAALRVAWFPIFYLIFMIPLPGVLVDAITGPLKQWISTIVVNLLYAVGYPIAQSGVIISIGQYQLLVADACSGLHSMFSLAALGTLFMYIMDRKSRLHNAIMLASIIPIAFIANICRVVILVLVTYYLGDAAGQGFLHGTAGFVLMAVALVIFFALDALLARFIGK